MTTEELKEVVQRDLDKIGASLDKYAIFFCNNTLQHLPGSYYSVENDVFYCTEIGDRGKIYPKQAFPGMEDALFKIYYHITQSMAISYAVKHSDEHKGQDQRRIWFPKLLELLKQIGEPYYIRGRKRIEETLRNAPYNDEPYRKKPKTFREWIAGLWK